MTIAFIQIPHRREPMIEWFDDEWELIDIAQGCAARDRKEPPVDFEHAVAYLCQMLEYSFVIQSVSDRQVRIYCNGHLVERVITGLAGSP